MFLAAWPVKYNSATNRLASTPRFGRGLLKQTKEKILVVDDDAAIRWALAEALRSWGYTPAEAGTVAACVAAFESEEPAAVLLDIDLPDGSGLDALREIKARGPEAVVVMVTGNVDIQNTISALRGGAYDFIAKPVNLEELRVTIQIGRASCRERV